MDHAQILGCGRGCDRRGRPLTERARRRRAAALLRGITLRSDVLRSHAGIQGGRAREATRGRVDGRLSRSGRLRADKALLAWIRPLQHDRRRWRSRCTVHVRSAPVPREGNGLPGPVVEGKPVLSSLSVPVGLSQFVRAANPAQVAVDSACSGDAKALAPDGADQTTVPRPKEDRSALWFALPHRGKGVRTVVAIAWERYG
jgi:hypothetical protein